MSNYFPPDEYIRYNTKECEECGYQIPRDVQSTLFCSEQCNVKYVIREEIEDIECEKRKA